MAEQDKEPIRFNKVAATLLLKLIDPEAVAPLAHYFKQYMLISDGSYGKVDILLNDNDNENALQHLIEFAMQHQSSNWDTALNNPKFPVCGDLRQLLKSVMVSSACNSLLDRLMKHWNHLEQCLDTIGDMLDLNISRLGDSRLKMLKVLNYLASPHDHAPSGRKDAVNTVLDAIFRESMGGMDQDQSGKRNRPSSEGEGNDYEWSQTVPVLELYERKRPRYDNEALSSYESESTSDSAEYKNSTVAAEEGMAASSAEEAKDMQTASDHDMTMGERAETQLQSLYNFYTNQQQKLCDQNLRRQTRSQTARSGNVETTVATENRVSKFEFSQEPPAQLNEGDYTIQLKCAVLHSFYEHMTLGIVSNANDWSEPAIAMKLDKGKNIYSIYVRTGQSTGEVHYKFCLLNLTSDTQNQIVRHENLYYSNGECNRVLHLSGLSFKNTIKYHNCSFEQSGIIKEWGNLKNERLQEFLPRDFAKYGTSSNWSTPEMEIFAWLSCMKSGVHLVGAFGYDRWTTRTLNYKGWEQILKNWLEEVHSSMSVNLLDRISMITTTVHVVLAMAREQMEVKSNGFLEQIFKIFDVSDFEKTDLDRLAQTIRQRYEELPEARNLIPKPQNALQFLFEKIQKVKPNIDWIFSLPLHWLLLGETPPHCKSLKGDLYTNSCLPKFNHVNWKAIREATMSKDPRPHILSLSGKVMEVSKTHLWMINTYQFMLKNEEVVDMIVFRENNKLLADFPIDSIFCQILQWWNGGRRQDSKLRSSFETCKNYVKDRLDQMTREVNSETAEDKCQQLYLQCCNLLDSCISYSKFPNVSAMKATEWALDLVVIRSAKFMAVANLKNTQDLTEKFENFITIIKGCIKTSRVTKKSVEYWGNLLKRDFQLEVWQAIWDKEILNEIKNTLDGFLSQQEDFVKYLKFYGDDLEDVEVHPKISEFFNQKMSHSVEQLMKSAKSNKSGIVNSIRAFFGGNDTIQPNVERIFDKWFQKEYINAKGTDSTIPENTVELRFLCGWSFSPDFYRIFGPGDFKAFNNKKLKEQAKKSSQHFSAIAKSLLKQEVTVEHLDIMIENKEQFLSLCCILKPDQKEAKADPTKKYKDAIEFCQKYLETFLKTRRTISDFIDVCHNGKLDEIPQNLNAAVKNDYRRMKVINGLTEEVDGNLTSCKYFGITSNELTNFEKTSFLKESQIFNEKFQQILEDYKQNTEKRQSHITMEDLIQAVEEVESSLMQLLDDICEGSISMAAVVQEFNCMTGNIDRVETEVGLLCKYYATYIGEMTDEHIIGSRIKQITNALQSKEANSAIDILLDLKDMLGIQGDFNDLSTRKKMTEQQSQVQLTDISITIDNAEVSEITEHQLNIVKKFMDGKEMISWIRQEMPSIREVGVMCQLALISAGENTMDVDKVSSFLRAVTDFAPLIFWEESPQKMQTDDRTEEGHASIVNPPTFGSKMLLDKCRQVWENASVTEGLLKKWRDTCLELEWMKKVKEFHGSVEKSSLSQAQIINEKGIYTISKNEKNMTTVENCMHLNVSDTGTDINFEELRELQSRLMLIAREAYSENNSVDVFIDVLSSVEKLAKTYVKLAASGCMLFADFKVNVACQAQENSSSDNIFISVQFAYKAPKICASGTYRDLDRITDVLQEAHKKWNHHISEMRMKYYHLNEFSVQQIMSLCHDLAEFRNGDNLSYQALTLLSFIREDVPDSVLKSCLDEAKRNIENNLTVKSDELPDAPTIDPVDEEMREIDPDVERKEEWNKKNKAVRKLMSEYDMSEKMAKAAVQNIGYADLTECWMWTVEGEESEEIIDELVQQFENQDVPMEEEESAVLHSAFSPNADRNTLINVISNLKASDENVTIVDKIKTICEGYFDETLGLDLDDHLSVSMLGETLDAISEHCVIHRRLLPGLHPRQPNVIVTTENEMVQSILALYKYDEDQPLPTRSEVLVCTSETSKDDVQRLLLRAMCRYPKSGRLLYTIAYADKLGYSATMAVEDMYYELLKNNNVDDNFQLVILLCDQQCHLTSSFEKYVVDVQWNVKSSDVRQYLQEHLYVANRWSAASIMPDRLGVKVISSSRSGVGKSLFIQRLAETLEEKAMESRCITVRFLESSVNVDKVISKLCNVEGREKVECAVLIHMDITPAVQFGTEAFAFNLFVLGSIEGSNGTVWRKRNNHLYAVEMLDFGPGGEERFDDCHILKLLPQVVCEPPLTVLKQEMKDETTDKGDNDKCMGMDEKNFQSETFQRPFQYLLRYQNHQDLDNFKYERPEGNPKKCIEVLLKHCCMSNPSWAQLHDFCSFLNVQLMNCEKSVYCSSEYFKEVLQGFKLFVVKFMIQMAQDFATPSLVISDTSLQDSENTHGFHGHQLRRRWEESSHPYVFFNEDSHTMSFINVKIDPNGYLLDANGQPLEGIPQPIASPDLVASLKRQDDDLSNDFNTKSREDKLEILCRVLGHRDTFDPDPSYELTTDNVLKILAVYMRFRCQIPVIIMGETGCGKTRLVEFLRKLKAGPNKQQTTSSMTTLKIHGGVTVDDIHESIKAAQKRQHQHKVGFNVLFYDEANTTEAIYAIKEVMCDKSIDGVSFTSSNIQIVAACNPYKKLSDDAIKKLEDSGLGYRIRTSETTHLFGNVPVRQLVYRVVALPPSMQPYIWDFGQLSNEAEKMYIEQMAVKLTAKLNLSQNTKSMITKVLSDCQIFMRRQANECRYVSLRDVERSMTTYEWFFRKSEFIYGRLQERIQRVFSRKKTIPDLHAETRTLIQTVGVCYHASLDDREEFRRLLAESLRLDGVDEEYLRVELAECQMIFCRDIEIEDNVAKNEALCENIFMMAVCADMQIPLFLIGKPGSSKSLAKTIIADNMRGNASHARLYKHLKQIQMQSFQCSAFTDVKGIETAFNQCSQIQKKLDPKTCTGVVVLDEIGLAEDSPNMPLKILHPLLERRSPDLLTVQQEQQDHTATHLNQSISEPVPEQQSQQVGFIGISNWALDPAKMNRGIFITRTKPSEDDLLQTGKEIFQANRGLWDRNEELLEALTMSYLNIYNEQEVEYYGLRDYYSMMKMLAQSKCREIPLEEVDHAILRNFSGAKEDVSGRFLKAARDVRGADDNGNSKKLTRQMIRENLTEKNSRYLLLLVQQFSVSSLLKSCIADVKDDVQIVFGSSFCGDLNYTDVCRNIKHVKGCMETGKTVILLNMSDIHESLYDALNQHYVTFGDQKYVDLGLGGHLVKCRIADTFRLIIVEIQNTVYETYPIPLVNRLEKHHFNAEVLLNEKQMELSKELKKWFRNFSVDCFNSYHAMIGFNEDTVSSTVQMSDGNFDQCKEIILNACSIDAMLRVKTSRLHDSEVSKLQGIYFFDQKHDSLKDILNDEFVNEEKLSALLITSYSSVLPKKYSIELCESLNISAGNFVILSLEYYSTQQQYNKHLDQFFENCVKTERLQEKKLLLIQCAQPRSKSALFACARHALMNRVDSMRKQINQSDLDTKIVVVLVISTEREGMSHSNVNYLALQHCSDVKIIYADELRTVRGYALASKFFNMQLFEVFESGARYLHQDEFDESLLDMNTLLMESTCVSLTKVKERATNQTSRHLERIKILMDLFKSNSTMKKAFCDIILLKMVALYKSEDAVVQTRTWIHDNASDMENLQEGGTFRKTIWLCLKKHMSRFLGFLVSVMDCCNNMDIIVKADGWQVDMWLSMLKTVNVTWSTLLATNIYEIRNFGNLKHCRIPFSFSIIEFFETKWTALSTNPQVDQEVFIRIFGDSKFRNALETAWKTSKQDQFIKDFIGDLVECLHATSNDAESQLIQDILYQIAIFNFKTIREQDHFFEGAMVAVIYLSYKLEMMAKLNPLSKTLREIPVLAGNVEEWKRKQTSVFESGSNEFKVHIFAFQDVLTQLKTMVQKIDNLRDCQDWLNLSGIVKGMYSSMESSTSDRAALSSINEDWKMLSLLDLFLVSMAPPIHPKDLLCLNYLKLFGPQARKFWDIMKKSNLLVLLKFLKLTLDQLSLKLLLKWREPRCGICPKKVVKPVILPCQHFGCKRCVLSHLSAEGDGEQRCFSCNEEIPEDFTPVEAILSESDMSKIKSKFTSFFLEYLERYFENKNDCSKEISQILEIIIAKNASKLDSTSLDLNINSKSCMLRILLKADEKITMAGIDGLLKEIDGEERDAFMLVIVKTLEMNQLSIMAKHSEEKLARDCQELISNDLIDLSIQDVLSFSMLHQVAKIRCCLIHLAALLNKKFKGGMDSLCDEACRFLGLTVPALTQVNSSHTLTNFLIKIGCHEFGTQWLFLLAKDDIMRGLIPQALLQAAASPEVDLWVLSNEEYQLAKLKLFHSDDYDYKEVIDEILDTTSACDTVGILALSSWLESKDENIDGDVCNVLKRKFPCLSHVDLITKYRKDLRFFLESNLPTSQQVQVIYQLVVLALASTEIGNSIMNGFKSLVVTPTLIPQLFLPCMPEDAYFTTPHLFRKDQNQQNSMYRCPNGHLYSIGDCTRPYVTSHCPECKAVIGGKSHKPAEGNERVIKEDSSQAGYLLNTQNVGYVSSGSERISTQGNAVVQFILHSCLLFSALKNPLQLQSILRVPEDEDVHVFLIEKLQSNLADMSKSIAKNHDDTVLVLHQILWNIIKQGARSHAENWSSLDSRKVWEQTFRNQYLQPVFQNIDSQVADARAVVRKSTVADRLTLSRILDDNNDVVQESSDFESPALWKIIKHPTSAHLLQKLQDGVESDRGDVIKVILQAADLSSLKYLENTLSLQTRLITKYAKRLDMNESETRSFSDHISDGAYGDKENIIEYIQCWNEVFPRLVKNCPDVAKKYMVRLNMDSPLAMALPSLKGMGLCAKLLSEYLIDVQNNFLVKCKKKITPSIDIPEVGTGEMTSRDFIQMDKGKDLLPLINMHTRYIIKTSEQGQKQHLISYNIEALEKQVRDKFVMRKKQIKKQSLPLMSYPQDVGIGMDWEKIVASTDQRPLTEKMKQDLDRVVQQSLLPDICEGVRTLANTIIFLAKVPEDSNKKLNEFLKKELKFPDSQISMIPESAFVCHVLALYGRLTWHKAVRFVQQNLKPFKAIADQEDITNPLLEKVFVAFKETDGVVLQRKINEMLIRATGTDSGDWSLADVFPEIDFLEDNESASWYTNLPGDLCVKHVAHLFELSVKTQT